MSTRISPTQAAQAAAEVRRHDAHLHSHSSSASGGTHRGQFRGYVFRLGRAPAAPRLRRPAALRRRPPRPPAAHLAGMDHDAEHGSVASTTQLRGTLALEEEELSASMEIDAKGGDENPDGGMRDGDPHQKYRALQWRVGASSGPEAVHATGLAGAQGGGGIDVHPHWAEALANDAMRPETLARALVAVMLDAHKPAAMPVPETQVTRLQLAAVRAYLMKMHQSSLERGPLSSLAHVKQLLLDSDRGGVQRPGRTLPDEEQQNLNLLLPLKLLNADRPRTPEQIQRACDRIELSCRSAWANVPPPVT